MSSGPQPSSPSHRSPLTLLSKLKRQLSKPPVAQHRKQPVEHQYLPIPTVSFSESVHSNRALSTYSCSNNSSSASSFVFIDHNEEPGSFGVDEYRPFLPLIIQHERLQRLAAVSPPRVAPPRARVVPPPNEPPSPTSTASSKSPVTPIFPSPFFDEDEDGIMALSSSEVGSISEYSLPRSLSPYMGEARSIRSRRGRKLTYQTSSDSESRHGRARVMSIRTPPPRTRKSFPPISPPPSCPLPEPPVPKFQAPTANTSLVMSDGESTSSLNRGRAKNLNLPDKSTAPPPPPVPALALLPAICLDPKTNPKARPESTTSILSELEIFDSSSAFAAAASASTHDQNENDDSNDLFTTRTSPSTPTPRQYGVGRQVIRGSGTGRDFGPNFGGDPTKRNSKRSSVKRDSTGMERKEVGLESKAEIANLEQLDKPFANEALDVQVNQDPTPTQIQDPTPIPRRRVKSDDTNPTVSTSANVSRRTTHREKTREKIHPEWTLFLGIPRNAAPPPPPPSVLSTMSSTGEQAAIPPLSTATAPPATTGKTQHLRHSLLPKYFPPTLTIRNRTKSDSALLASASASASGANTSDTESKAKTKPEGEDWTLSLPLVVPPTTPSSASSAAVPRESKYFETPSGSASVQPEVAEECQARVGEVVITVEDVDGRQQGKEKRRVRVRRSEEYEDESREDDEAQEAQELVLRVPRIVRSCSSVPLLSSTPSNASIRGRRKKSSTKWMRMASSPDLRVSSRTLEEEVMCMLLGDEDESKSRSRSSSSSSSTKKDIASAMDLVQKRMATLDEDLARFNALLRNGSVSASASRPASMVIETAVAAAAAATKPKTVTLNSQPESIPPPTITSTSPIKKKPTQTLKPVLKHAKSCEPFLESSVHPFPPPPPSMGPVMRFPSSTERGDLNFFDELGGDDIGGGSGRRLEQSRASLRLTRSAEWIMGELGDTSMALGLSDPVSTMSASARASPPPPPQRQQRTTASNTPSTTATQTLLLPFASSSALKSSGSFDRVRRGGVPTMPFRAVSMGSLSRNTVPVESNLGFTTSHKEKQRQHHPKRSPSHLCLHTPSLSSSSSSASSCAPSHGRIIINIDATTPTDTNDRRRSVSPPPSPIHSESSSALPTPLASAFPLPPSPRISMSRLGGVAAFQQKLREFECARERQLQQKKRGGSQYLAYRSPSTASSVCSLVSNASSTSTVVPSGDQKMRIRAGGVPVVPVPVSVQERGRGRETGDVQEDDENSTCSTTYYSARSSFSQERV